MPQTRQLAAIMFTDIVGYTALMGEDEQKAFSILNENRLLQKPIIEKYGGRWIKELGDGVLATFSTATDAVLCASEIQNACSTTDNLKLRIGIHMGEIMLENDDVFGDGVNIASRLQAIASAGCIWISDAVQKNISNKKDIQTIFIRKETLKHVKEPVLIYQVVAGESNKIAFSAKEQTTNETERSIAVLPFVNMSNDPEQEYFCDGISEEIINALAQLDNLRVISRTSAFSFKGKNVDVREIGKMLDVDTLLEGSVRKAGNQLRITTKLVKASNGSHVWSDKYDRVLEDVFMIQENIAESVATALKGYLTNIEKDAIRRPETNIEAYEFFLKGRQLLHRTLFDEAKKMFQRAIQLDSNYAPAYAGLADVHSWLYEWFGGSSSDLTAAEAYSKQALTLAPNLSESHSSRGYVLALAKRYTEAEEEFEQAIALNSNNFDAYYHYGRSSFARGQIEKSAELFRKASESRREDFQSMLLLSQSLRMAGLDNSKELKDGINRARKQLDLNPTDARALSLTAPFLVEIGARDEGLEWINKALELYPDDAGVLINGACLFAEEGNKEKAITLLERAFGKGFGKKEWIEKDPSYDSLRNEPRFQVLLNKLK
jgi:adenylate cyclase